MKVEIDTRPPVGAETETRLVRRFVMLNLLHYDRASLLAGKLHAVLSRKYTKGRDHECSGLEARHALEVMMGIFESAAYGMRVDLPQARRDNRIV